MIQGPTHNRQQVVNAFACDRAANGQTDLTEMTMAGIGSFVYRNRAGGARDIASVTLDGVSRRLLLEIAHDYEEIAETLDRITAIEGVIRKRQTAGAAADTNDTP